MSKKYPLSIDYKRSFQAMWLWLSKHPTLPSSNSEPPLLTRKQDWPGFKTVCNLEAKKLIHLTGASHFGTHACFACQSAGMSMGKVHCENCPVNFGFVNNGLCEHITSYFKKWIRTQRPEIKSKYAKLIAKGWRK